MAKIILGHKPTWLWKGKRFFQEFHPCTVALFLVLGISECLWMDQLCRNKREIDDHYENSTLVFYPINKNTGLSGWKYRKLCIFHGNTKKKVCMEMGMPMSEMNESYPELMRIHRADTVKNGRSYPLHLRIRRAVVMDEEDTDYTDEEDNENISHEPYYEEDDSDDTDDDDIDDDDTDDESRDDNHEEYEDENDVDYSSFDVDPSTACKVPQGLNTAEILCKSWPSSITCKSYCVYGHTFPEGIVRTLKCTYKENKWSEEFEECKPFIDCKLKLTSPGTIKCRSNELQRSPGCEIYCERYSTNDETQSQIYSCRSNGIWSPPLPFCVKQRGSYVVAAPKVVEHYKVEYP